MTFHNDTSQKERAAILKNDVRVNTMHGRTMLDLEQELTGRFAKPSVVTAGEGAPTYPSGAPWTQDHTGLEAPLGVDINAMEPVGEQFEVDRSRASSVANSHNSVERDHGAGAAPSQPPMSSAPATLSGRQLFRRPL
jgi:hypothetical protein